jgi:2-oxoglutarate ferredoxin oxidoreductase subunit gamma
VVEALKKVYGAGKEHFIPLNQKALEEGAKAVRSI